MGLSELPPPSSDQDRLNHMAQWHGMPSYTVGEWKATFPRITVAGQHKHLHESGYTRNHKHVRKPGT